VVLTEQRARELAGLIAAASAESEVAWQELKVLGADVVPYLADAFFKTRTWQGRVALVYHCIRFARESDSAFDLGLRGLQDRSYMVRYRACGLLAYSLRQDALPHLQSLLAHGDKRTIEDATAAIAAVTSQNHHRFVDRSNSGRSFWEVNPGDRPT
jgi:hypothetical protein